MRDTIPAPEWAKVCDEFAASLEAKTKELEQEPPPSPVEFARWIGDQLQGDLDSYGVTYATTNEARTILTRNGVHYLVTIGEPYR